LENIYIIGDVHGCYKTLLALIDKLPNKKDSKIVFVGDLVDRGANSYDVIKFVMDNNYDCVLGNHEKMFLEYSPMLENDRQNEDLKYWLFKCGGEQTLKSYKSKEEFYKQLDFLKSLPLYIEYKDYKTDDGRYLVVSHSSVGQAWEFRYSANQIRIKRFESQLLWSRYKDFDNSEIFNVYGHTIFEEPVINKYSSAIDLGCYQSKEKLPNPRLCALEFPSMKVYTQESLED
jgi:serine/threonine protein phosphatase 1